MGVASTLNINELIEATIIRIVISSRSDILLHDIVSKSTMYLPEPGGVSFCEVDGVF